jgi:deoxyxylulose-5-phosphate synthase
MVIKRNLLGLDEKIGNVDVLRELEIELILQQVKKESKYIIKYGIPKNISEQFKMADKVEEQKFRCKKVKDLFNRVKELGMDSVAITEHGNMESMINKYKEAKKKRKLGLWKGKVKISKDFNDTEKEIIDMFHN